MSATRRLLPALVALLVALGAPAQEQHESIGKKGAAVTLPKSWNRQVMNKDLGPDQFQARATGGIFTEPKMAGLVVLEVEALLENRADYRRVLDLMSVIGHDAKMEIVEGPRWIRVARTTDTDVNGMSLTYCCELLIRDGLAYHLMAWSGQDQRSFLEARVAEFRDGFAFPENDSAWARAQQAVPYRRGIGNYELSFSYRPGIYKSATQEGYFAKWVTADDEHGLYLTEFEEIESAGRAVAWEHEILRDWDNTYRFVERAPRKIDGVDCWFVSGRTEYLSVQALLMPVGGQRWAVLRYLATGSASDRRPERDAIFDSVKLNEIAGELQLPAIDVPTEPASVTRLGRFLQTVPERHAFNSWNMSAQLLADGTHVVWDWQNVFHVGADGYTLVLADGDGQIEGATRVGDRWLVVQAGKAYFARDGALAATPEFEARCVLGLGDGVLVVRAVGKELLGLNADFANRTAKLFRRTAAGVETEVAAFGRAHVQAIAVDRAGQRVLVSGAIRDAYSSELEPTVWQVDLGSGAVAPFGSWREVTALGSAAEGWIVTGRPSGKCNGIWHQPVFGEITPLVTGRGVAGLSATATALVFANGTAGKWRIREVSLERCQSEGRGVAPWGLDALTIVGQALLADRATVPPSTRSTIDSTVQRLQQIAPGVTGHPLPIAAADLDELAAQLFDPEYPVTAPARVVLNLLFAAAALTGGAEWIETPVGDWSPWHLRSAPARGSSFALAKNPCNLVASCLDDGEGVAAVLQELRDEAAGRRILLGVDPTAVSQRARELVPPEFAAALRDGDEARLGAILAANSDNTVLAREVYSVLAAAGKLTLIETLARERATRGKPLVTDLLAWFAAWNERAREPAAAERMFELAMRAVEQHPREAPLYYFLGQAAGRAFPGAPGKARRCYERVLELQQWGEFAEAARAGLGQ